MSAFVIKERMGGRILQLPDTEDSDAAKLQRFCELNRDIRAELDVEGMSL